MGCVGGIRQMILYHAPIPFVKIIGFWILVFVEFHWIGLVGTTLRRRWLLR